MKALAAVILIQFWLSACGAAIPKVVQERWWRFPAAGRFNHLVLSIPVQRGIAQPLILDPTCQRCDPGTLPWWSHGTKALRIDASDPPRIVEVQGPPAPPRLAERRVSLQVGEDGTVTGTWRGRFQGLGATVLRRRLNRRGVAAKKKKIAGAVVRRLWKGAQVSSHLWSFPADPREGVGLQVDFEVLGAAQRVDAETILPMDFMRNPAFDGIHCSRTRVAPLEIQAGRRFEDLFEITGPPGTSVGRLPERVSVTAAFATYRQSAGSSRAGVVVRRSMELNRGRAPRALYVGMRWMLRRASGILGQALRFRSKKHSRE